MQSRIIPLSVPRYATLRFALDLYLTRTLRLLPSKLKIESR
jgi:hypothetical protein